MTQMSDYTAAATSAAVTETSDPFKVDAGGWWASCAMLGDGYDVAAAAERRQPPWRPVWSWGVSGWDLGDPPYVQFFVRRPNGPGGPVELVQYVEGDTYAWRYPDEATYTKAMDAHAAWYWVRNGRGPKPEDIDAGKHKGPCRPELWSV